MSTADFVQQENTVSVNQDGNTMYRLGNSETDSSSIEDSVIKPRSPRHLVTVASISNKIEDIKQKWNGVVIDCNDHELTARLEDLTDPKNPDEIVVLSIEEIDKGDQTLIQNGAVFLWQIGYRQGSKYPRERFSKISFRRLPKWTEEDIQDAEKLAKEYADFFSTDSTHTT